MSSELGPPSGALAVGDAPAGAAGRVPAPTPGTELLGAADEDELYLVRRGDGQVVRMPWLLQRVVALADGERDVAAIAEAIGAEHDHPVTVEEVFLVLDRRLVPAGLVVLPGGDPPVPAGRGARRRAPTVAATLVLAALALVAATAAATVLVVRPAPAPAVQDTAVGPAQDRRGITAPGGVDGPPTLLGRVLGAPDVASAVVDVGARALEVEVVGLVPGGTPSCVVDEARAYAQRTLVGQEVVLVPDPTLPPPSGDRYRAYLVLPSQQSYTDAALRAGWARAGEGRYRPGFVDAEDQARRAGAGLWGSECSPQP